MDIEGWMKDLVAVLRAEFAGRLLFVGLQGSRRRGEATPESDIDAVVILDRVDVADLRRYRAIVDALPEADKACGFIGGKNELLRWPRYELFQFRNDTRAYFGDLDDYLPEITREDIRDSVRFSAAALYHMTAHLYVHGRGEDRTADLRGAYKGTFFILLAKAYLDGGGYAEDKKALLNKLSGLDREILDTAIRWDELEGERKAGPDKFFDRLLTWSGGLISS